MINNNPFNLTDEEINELLTLISADSIGSTVNPHLVSNYWNDDDWDFEVPPTIPTRVCNHVYIPVLLINSTVYDCKLCGKHKEDDDETF